MVRKFAPGPGMCTVKVDLVPTLPHPSPPPHCTALSDCDLGPLSQAAQTLAVMSWLRRRGHIYLGYLALLLLSLNLVLLPDTSWRGRTNSASHFPAKKNIVRRAAKVRDNKGDINTFYPGEREREREREKEGEEEYFRFKNNTVVRLWLEKAAGFPWRKCLKEQKTLLLVSGCVSKVHQQADQTFTVLSLPGEETKFKLLHVRRFRMFLVRPDQGRVVRALGYSHSPADYWRWSRRTGQLTYGETGLCLTAGQHTNRTTMAPCGAGPDQGVEFGVDTETEGENSIRPLVEEHWAARMKVVREDERKVARETVVTALAEMTAVLSSQSGGRAETGGGRRALVVQVERGDSASLPQLAWWQEAARLAGLLADNQTDLVVFTHPSCVSLLPPQCRPVREELEQAGPARCLFRPVLAGSQSDLVDILAGPASSFLTRYQTLLRADLHSLPSPGLGQLRHLPPGEVLVSRPARPAGPRLTSVEEAVERTAREVGLEHRGWHQLGTTILGPPPVLRTLARLTLALETLSLAEMFGAGTEPCRCSTCSQLAPQCQRGRGPWPGHARRYAENIALNALLTESQYLSSLQHLRQGDSSEPDLDLCSLGLVDTTGDKEGRAVLERQARFTNYDMSQLDLTTARGFSLYTALTSTEQGRGAPRTTQGLCSTGAGGPTL